MSKKTVLDRLFVNANRQWEAGRIGAAFHLFRRAAATGHANSMISLGYLLDTGVGTHPSKNQALSWYRKAAILDDICAYSNIGTIYRDRKDFVLARMWFLKALQKGDGDAALELGKLYLGCLRSAHLATSYLGLALTTTHVTEASRDEAKSLLKALKGGRATKS